MDSWQDILGTTIEKGYYFQFHWMDSPEERARKAEEIETFNFIGWIPDEYVYVSKYQQDIFQFHWMDSSCKAFCRPSGADPLSISLDGF